MKGNCDEAEHANDPECVGADLVPEDDHGNDDQGDVNDDDGGDVDDDDQGENEERRRPGRQLRPRQRELRLRQPELRARQLELGERELASLDRASRRRPYLPVRPPSVCRLSP